MLKALKWIGIGLVVLLIVVGVLWTISRLMGPTEEQEQALEVLAQKGVPEGRNAFPAIWLLPYDVPEGQLETVTAEDAERFRKLPTYDPDNVTSADIRSVAHERFGRLVDDEFDDKRCNLRDPGCLAKVHADPDGYARWREDNAKLIDRAQVISQYDYYRYPFPLRVDLLLPRYGDFRVLPTARAVDFVHGRAGSAIDGICTDLATWRKLSNDADSLIFSMVARAGIRGSSVLLAEMLQESPADFPLPQSCATAAAVPKLGELSLCNAMRGEALYAKSIAQEIKASGSLSENRLANVFAPLLFDSDGMEALSAPTYAWACTQEAKQLMIEDRPLQIPPRTRIWRRFECVGNAAGCLLGDIAAPEFDGYLQRGQDTGAQIKLLATLLWLRERTDDSRALAERLASRPDELKSPTRDIEVVDEGKALSIRMFDDGHGETFELPLPAYLQDAVVTNSRRCPRLTEPSASVARTTACARAQPRRLEHR